VAGFFVLNLGSPGTLFFSAVWPLPAIVLPWGERLYRFGGTLSGWGAAFHLATYGAFLWALWRTWWQRRRSGEASTWLLAVCLLLQFAALLWGDIVVDTLHVDAPYLDGFAFLPFVLLMSLSLAVQLRQRSLELVQARRALDAEAHTRRQAESELRQLAYHDGLTGLPNRAQLLSRMAEVRSTALASRRYGAMLLVDLDNFKTINDGLGHLIGDRLLQAVANQMRVLAPGDALLARLGGDEFVVLLGPLKGSADELRAQAQALAEALIARLAEPTALDGRMLAVGASVGIALFPDGERDVNDLLRRADIALYGAKGAGRGIARAFAPAMQEVADTRLLLERGLRAALEQGNLQRQFALHFQPQVSLDGKVQGAEALLRWTHPQSGPISPEVFIPLAEETGLIHVLGAWVIGEACARLQAWDRDGVPFAGRLAVNVSAWQLAAPQFVERVVAQVQDSGLSPSRFTLELTESALLRDADGALAILHRLVDAGFSLALDDFGTGYSSLRYLQRLPLKLIKIDRAFVRTLAPGDASPLAAFIVDVAHRLGMATVGEGVETQAQRRALERLGCDGLQGYLISRPLDDVAFRHWLAGRRTPPAGA
jgi:diguanylate cyclase (GGDEF)-like protein